MSRKRKHVSKTISATVTEEVKQQLFDLKQDRGTSYASLIRHALVKTYGIGRK